MIQIHVVFPVFSFFNVLFFHPIFSFSCSQKAIDAAIQARQWNKAVQIVELQDEDVVEK